MCLSNAFVYIAENVVNCAFSDNIYLLLSRLFASEIIQFLFTVIWPFRFHSKSSFQQKRRRKRYWNFKRRLSFILTNRLTERSRTSPCDVMV